MSAGRRTDRGRNGRVGYTRRFKTTAGATPSSSACVHLTARTAVEAATRVVGGAVEPGFQTAGMAFGPDFILEFEGVEREGI